jgi:hypothetical protein
MCNASGAPFDIMRHERFDHGHYFPIGKLDDDDDMAAPPTGLTPLSSLKLPQEVNQLFQGAVSAFTTREKKVTTEISFGPFMLFDALSTSQECRFVDFEFQDNSCKCSVDVRHTELEHSTNFALPPYMRVQGMLDICIQTSPNTAPLDLLSLGILSCSEETSEASIETSATVQMALGLQDTCPAQLLARGSLVTRHAVGLFQDCRSWTNFCGSEDFASVPTLYQAYQIWLAAEDLNEATVEG